MARCSPSGLGESSQGHLSWHVSVTPAGASAGALLLSLAASQAGLARCAEGSPVPADGGDRQRLGSACRCVTQDPRISQGPLSTAATNPDPMRANNTPAEEHQRSIVNSPHAAGYAQDLTALACHGVVHTTAAGGMVAQMLSIIRQSHAGLCQFCCPGSDCSSGDSTQNQPRRSPS